MNNAETLAHWAYKTQDQDKQNTTQKTKKKNGDFCQYKVHDT
jgi:hypothetical protein